MAINLNDQQMVGLGGSSIAPRDTFSTPGMDQGAQRNAEALARSLEGFAGAVNGYGDAVTKSRDREAAALLPLRASKLVESLNQGEAIDVATGKIAPNLSYWNKAATQQAAGELWGTQLAQQVLTQFPANLVDKPEELSAWYQAQTSGIREQYKDNPFFSAGITTGLSKKFEEHKASQFAEANAASLDTQKSVGIKQLDDLGRSFAPPKPITQEGVRTGYVAPPSQTTSYRVNTGAAVNKSAADAVVTTANSYGLNPYELAALVSYETGGTFNPDVRGGKNNAHIGLIQFGPEEQQKYGIRPGMTIEQQMFAVGKYLRDRGAKPGDSLLTLYKIVNGGNRNVSEDASDGNGTIKSHVEKIRKEHMPNAVKFLTGNDDPRLASQTSSTQVSTQPSDGFIRSTPEAPSIFGYEPLDMYVNDPDVVAYSAALTAWDEERKGTLPQLDNRTAKSMMINSAIRTAIERNDPRLLAALNPLLLNPDEKMNVRKAFDMVSSQKWQTWERDNRVAEQQRREWSRSAVSKILDKVRNGQTISAIEDAVLPDGSIDYEVWEKATNVANNGIPTRESGAFRSTFQSDLENAAATNNWDRFASKYPGFRKHVKRGQVPTIEDLNDFILDLPMNAGDIRDIQNTLPTTLEQGDAARDASYTSYYSVRGVGAMLDKLQTTDRGRLILERDPNIAATTSDAYWDEVQRLTGEIFDSGRKPTVADKNRIAEAATAKAMDFYRNQIALLNLPSMDGKTPMMLTPDQQGGYQGNYDDGMWKLKENKK